MSPFLALASQVQSAARATLPLFGDYSLADPWFLVLLPVGALLFLFSSSRRARVAGRVSVLPTGLARSTRQRFLFLPTALQVFAFLCIVIGLARPLRSNVESQDVSEGVDIVLCIDRSSSMQFDDLEKGKSRLDVVKEVVGDFARRRMSDREGAADACALLAFARYPQLMCPFTLDVDAFEGFLDRVEMVRVREEDGTAIGVALAKAVAVLDESPAKSRIVVLLTDGENNQNEIAPLDAAELAAEKGIRVYTVYSARYRYEQRPFQGLVAVEGGFDTSELEAIAKKTDGRFYHARDREELEGIYAEIERLERTPRSEKRFEENFDLYPRWILAAATLEALAWIFRATWARRVL
ncbi:MAG TPA: VWA domain-containing protein [Planctomycetes bacterium]|nr:VWA domain-containing protein [Planctomycetota bacterium]